MATTPSKKKAAAKKQATKKPAKAAPKAPLALLAAGDPAAVRDLPWPSQGAKVVGLLLADAPPAIPFPKNPWGIAPKSTVADAVAKVWKPFAALAPRWVDVLAKETLALALVRGDDGTTRLAYAHYWPEDGADDDSPRPRRAALAKLEGKGVLGWFVGDPPAKKPGRARALAELFAAHARIETGLANLSSPEQLVTLEELWKDVPDASASFTKKYRKPAKDFLVFFGYGDDRLTVLDPKGLACEWEGGTFDLARKGEPIGAWAERNFPEQFLHRPAVKSRRRAH